MENELFTVGIVIADKDEYVHIDKYIGPDATAFEMQGIFGHTISVSEPSVVVSARLMPPLPQRFWLTAVIC